MFIAAGSDFSGGKVDGGNDEGARAKYRNANRRPNGRRHERVYFVVQFGTHAFRIDQCTKLFLFCKSDSKWPQLHLFFFSL